MQAFPPVSRCAAGALDRDAGQAGLGKRGDEPWFTPNSASCRVRFRFAAGEPKADGTRTPSMDTLIQKIKYLFERRLSKLLRQRRQHFGNLSLQMRVSHHPMLTQEF